MNRSPVFDYQMSVAELLAQYPECIPVFLRHHMACVGCTMAPFDTLGEAVRNYPGQGYNLPSEDFLEELRGVVESQPKESDMPEIKPACLVCEQTSAEIPLLTITYQDHQYWICPSHFPILIHQPGLLVGKLPGAEKIQPHQHD